MKYRKYGNTGLNLSVIGCGGTRYNREKSIEENAQRLIYGYEKGINHFDSYNYGDCEKIIAYALKQLPKNSYFTSTKDQTVFFKSKDEFKAKFYRSLETMQVDYYDLYYIWNMKKMSEYDECLKLGGFYESILDLKSEGLIRHVGLSSHLEGSQTAQIIKDGKIEGVLLNMNVLNYPYAIEAAIEAKKQGIGVGVMSPLSGGIIPQHENSFDFLVKGNKTVTYEALRFITSLKYVDFCYLAASNKHEIDFACDVVDNSAIMSDSEFEQFGNLIGKGLNNICTSCLYCNDVCPQNINIPAYMQIYNHKIICGKNDDEIMDQLAFAKKWFMLANTTGNAYDCIGCRECEKLCTQHLDITNRLEYLGGLEKQIT